MNPEASIPPVLQIEESAPRISNFQRAASTAWRTLVFFWKYVLGALFCQTILGSMIVVGWTYRLAQRSALRYWWTRSDQKRKGTRLADHLKSHDLSHEHGHWPNWLFHQNFRQAVRRPHGTSTLAYVWQLLKAPFQSLGLNVKLGLQGIFNTWVLTLPACILWLFAWY